MTIGNFWNHRVVRVKDLGTESGKYLILQEVYYKDSKPDMRTIDGAKVGGESIEELRRVLNLMLKSLDQDILDENDFPIEEQ